MTVARFDSSDPQKLDLYRVEAKFGGSYRDHNTPRRRLLEVLKRVCDHYGADYPNLRLARRLRHPDAAGDYSAGHPALITLYPANGGASVGCLLHEVAHHVTQWFYPDAQNHGPEFVGFLMYLYHHHRIIDRESFQRLCQKEGVYIGRRYRPSQHGVRGAPPLRPPKAKRVVPGSFA